MSLRIARHDDGHRTCESIDMLLGVLYFLSCCCRGACGAALSLVLIWKHPRNSEVRRSLSQSFRLRSGVANFDITF